MKPIFYLILFITILNISCDSNQSIEISNNKLAKEQQRIIEKKNEFDNLYVKAPNSIKKDEIQKQFDTWLTSYFRDTLNGKIKDFYVKVNDVSSGLFQNRFYFVTADFRTDNGMRFFEEGDFKTEKEMKKYLLYNKILNVKEHSNAKLNATFNKLDDFNASDLGSSSIRFRTISISVDTVLNSN